LAHSPGSANEVDHWLPTTLDFHLAPEERVRPLLALTLEILKMLSTARATLSQQLEQFPLALTSSRRRPGSRVRQNRLDSGSLRGGMTERKSNRKPLWRMAPVVRSKSRRLAMMCRSLNGKTRSR
jgi:hypothetical protein